MAWLICVGGLAALGLFGVMWCLFGWLLPKTGGVMLCRGEEETRTLVRRYLWLRGLGLLECRVIVLDWDMAPQERLWMEEHGIEICSREELPFRLGIGAKESHGTGNGDPPGRSQRSGVSEL